MTSIEVLYNDSYGDGFVVSDAFLAEYEARTKRTLDMRKELMRIGDQSIRCDPVAIAIFKEKGSEWCSGVTASLALRSFSSIFANYWEIEEKDGDEYVRLQVTDALADILHVFMKTGDKATLTRQYNAIRDAALAATAEMFPGVVVIKPEEDNVISHVGYGYFDAGPEPELESEVDSGHA
jgi:hypothetical protein